jgi:hypothetical protein
LSILDKSKVSKVDLSHSIITTERQTADESTAKKGDHENGAEEHGHGHHVDEKIGHSVFDKK